MARSEGEAIQRRVSLSPSDKARAEKRRPGGPFRIVPAYLASLRSPQAPWASPGEGGASPSVAPLDRDRAHQFPGSPPLGPRGPSGFRGRPLLGRSLALDRGCEEPRGAFPSRGGPPPVPPRGSRRYPASVPLSSPPPRAPPPRTARAFPDAQNVPEKAPRPPPDGSLPPRG